MSKIRVGNKVYCIKTYDNDNYNPGGINPIFLCISSNMSRTCTCKSHLEGKIYNIAIIDNNINENWKTNFYDIENIRHIYIESEPGITNCGNLGFSMPNVYSTIYPQFYDHFIFLSESRKLKLEKLIQSHLK